MLTNDLRDNGANTSEAENIIENSKKGTQRGHSGLVSPAVIPFPKGQPHPLDTTEKPDRTDKTNRAAKSSVDYWKTRVRPRCVRGVDTPELYLRLKEGGQDAWFSLATANRAEAARKARDLWVKVQAQGLAAVLAELRPDKRPELVCTLGDYLTAAKALSTVRPTTLADYESALRRIVAGVRGIVSKSRRPVDLAAWRERVDAVRLDKVTPADVRSWQKRQLDTAKDEGGEIQKDRRVHTIASDLRDARSLFSEAIIAEVGKTLALPSPLPFEGIAAAATTRRFTCKLDARALYAAAADLDADTRTAFDLLLCAGLRRGEADALPWSHVDLQAGTVTVDVTPTFRPKSKESYRTVPIPADVVARLKAHRAATPRADLVLAPRPTKAARKPARDKTSKHLYRARAWPALVEWLKGQGLDDLTPLHALRKMSGSFIYATAGLEAARLHLGHSNIATTAASYVTARSVTVDLSEKPEGKK